MSRLLEEVQGLVLLEPWLLAVALLVVPVLLPRRRSRRASLVFAPAPLLFGGGAAGERVVRAVSWRFRPRWLPMALRVLGLLLIAVALARPARRVAEPRSDEGIDVLLCCDVSSSMAETDLDAARSRLVVAREAARRFVARRTTDRVGLVAFARYPDLLCPPTRDHVALGRFLDRLEIVSSDGPEDATGIGTAVALAARIAAASDATSRIVILLTDGEENVATAQSPEEIAPVHAGQLARELGVKVYTVAVGTGRRDERGEFAPIDTGQIKRLAEKTEGRFWAARDAAALEGVYATIDALETVAFDSPRFIVEERFAVFLVTALLLLVLGRALEATLLEELP